MTLEKKVDRIYECLIGDELNVNSVGLVDQVRQNTKEIENLKKTKANRFDWSKIFKIVKIAKTTTGT